MKRCIFFIARKGLQSLSNGVRNSRNFFERPKKKIQHALLPNPSINSLKKYHVTNNPTYPLLHQQSSPIIYSCTENPAHPKPPSPVHFNSTFTIFYPLKEKIMPALHQYLPLSIKYTISFFPILRIRLAYKKPSIFP